MSNSYYKNIDGKNYDREMLEIADEAVAGVGDGRISLEDAQKLLGAVKDANKYTDIEKDTMKYIRENYRFTYASDQWFRKEIRKWAATKGKDNDENTKTTGTASQTEFIPSKSYYRVIDGKQYVRSILDAADVRLEAKGNGLISEENFEQIVELSRDGKGITGTEMRTLEYIGLKYNLTTKARLWFEENLEQIRSEVIKSEQTSAMKLSQAINKEQEEITESEQLLDTKYSEAINKEQEEITESEQPSDAKYSEAINKEQEEVIEKEQEEVIEKEQEEVIEKEQPSSAKYSEAIKKEQEKVFESDSYENKKTTIEHIRPIMNENHHKSMLLVHVLWAAFLLISVITVRSFFIDQVVDADQNIEKLEAVTQNNKLLQEQLKTMQIEKIQFESKFQGLEQNLNDQLIKQKKIESTLSLQNSQATKETKPEVIVFKPDQNNCCFCSCGNSAFEESLQKFR